MQSACNTEVHQINDLSAWRCKDRASGETSFVPDGINDLGQWKDAKPQILFVLREPSEEPKNPTKSMIDFFASMVQLVLLSCLPR